MDIWHIIPTNDLKPHCEVTSHTYVLGDELHDLKSGCECEPTISVEDGRAFVIHNSFDGREGVEWTNEILGNKSDYTDDDEEEE